MEVSAHVAVVYYPLLLTQIVASAAGLLAYKLGDFQEAHDLAQKSKAAFPGHADTAELVKQLSHHFTML